MSKLVLLFAEDFGHENFIKSLLYKMAEEYETEIEVRNRIAKGGHGRVMDELRVFISDLSRHKERLPDLLVIAVDANCNYTKRKKEVENEVRTYKDFTVCAIPDPHIERWMLLDSAAFKSVFGEGCKAPDKKCEKDRYKNHLYNSIKVSGTTPLIGGMEFAEDVVKAMNLSEMKKNRDFERFLKDLRRMFNSWEKCRA